MFNTNNTLQSNFWFLLLPWQIYYTDAINFPNHCNILRKPLKHSNTTHTSLIKLIALSSTNGAGLDTLLTAASPKRKLGILSIKVLYLWRIGVDPSAWFSRRSTYFFFGLQHCTLVAFSKNIHRTSPFVHFEECKTVPFVISLWLLTGSVCLKLENRLYRNVDTTWLIYSTLLFFLPFSSVRVQANTKILIAIFPTVKRLRNSDYEYNRRPLLQTISS